MNCAVFALNWLAGEWGEKLPTLHSPASVHEMQQARAYPLPVCSQLPNPEVEGCGVTVADEPEEAELPPAVRAEITDEAHERSPHGRYTYYFCDRIVN